MFSIYFLVSNNKDVEQRVWWDCDEERYQRRWTIQGYCGNIISAFQVCIKEDNFDMKKSGS